MQCKAIIFSLPLFGEHLYLDISVNIKKKHLSSGWHGNWDLPRERHKGHSRHFHTGETVLREQSLMRKLLLRECAMLVSVLKRRDYRGGKKRRRSAV